MKSIQRIKTLLMNYNVVEKEFSNNVTFPKQIAVVPTFDCDLAVDFINNIIFNNDIEGGRLIVDTFFCRYICRYVLFSFLFYKTDPIF